jgi:hypothetical protein
MYPVHPSSPAAWSRKYLPDGSSKSSVSAGLDKPDDGPSKRTGRQLPGGSRPCRPAPGGSPRWRGNVKSVAPRRKGEAIVARTSLFRRRGARRPRRSGRAGCSRLRHEAPGRPVYAGQLGISQPVPRGMPTEWARQPGLGPMLPGGHHDAADVPAIAVAAAPVYRLALEVRPPRGPGTMIRSP